MRPILRLARALLPVLLAAATPSCGSSATPPDAQDAPGADAQVPVDGPMDAIADAARDDGGLSVDAGLDASDARIDVSADVSMDVPQDSQLDAPSDARADTAADSRADASGDALDAASDAALDAASDAGATDPALAEGWSPPGAIVPPAGDAQYQLRLAADSAGNTSAVWSHGRPGTRYDSEYARWSPSAGWSAPMALATGGADAYPDLAVSASGDAIVVWGNTSLEGNGVFALRRTGGAWQPREFASGTTSVVLGPRAALGPAGAALVAWTGNTSASSRSARAMRYTPGVGWSAVQEFPPPAGGVSQGTARVATDAAGNGWVVFVELSTTRRGTIAASALAAGGTWSALSRLSTSTVDASNVEVVADGAGTALAVWTALGTVSRVEAARYASGAWSAVEPVSAPGATAGALALTTDSTGRATAVWGQYGAGAGLWVAQRERGAWSVPVELVASSDDFESPRVAADAAGNLVLAWVQRASASGGAARVWSSRLRAGASAWSTPVALSPETVNASEPAVAAGGAGIAVVGWTETPAAGEPTIVIRTRTAP